MFEERAKEVESFFKSDSEDEPDAPELNVVVDVDNSADCGAVPEPDVALSAELVSKVDGSPAEKEAPPEVEGSLVGQATLPDTADAPAEPKLTPEKAAVEKEVRDTPAELEKLFEVQDDPMEQDQAENAYEQLAAGALAELKQQSVPAEVELQQRSLPAEVELQQRSLPAEVQLQQRSLPTEVEIQQQSPPAESFECWKRRSIANAPLPHRLQGRPGQVINLGGGGGAKASADGVDRLMQRFVEQVKHAKKSPSKTTKHVPLKLVNQLVN